MFGKMELENFEGITTMPQEAASAWNGGFEDLLGAEYKPLLYLGKQVARGVNYFFIAEQTLIVKPPCRRVVKVIVNDFNGEYQLVGMEEI